jgi:hypothetical protein
VWAMKEEKNKLLAMETDYLRSAELSRMKGI